MQGLMSLILMSFGLQTINFGRGMLATFLRLASAFEPNFISVTSKASETLGRACPSVVWISGAPDNRADRRRLEQCFLTRPPPRALRSGAGATRVGKRVFRRRCPSFLCSLIVFHPKDNRLSAPWNAFSKTSFELFDVDTNPSRVPDFTRRRLFPPPAILAGARLRRSIVTAVIISTPPPTPIAVSLRRRDLGWQTCHLTT